MDRRRGFRAVSAALLLLLAVLGPGQAVVVGAATMGSVSGRVTDADGRGVVGRRVAIRAVGKVAVTGADGIYAIDPVPTAASPYDVQLLSPCTGDQVKRVVVDGAEAVNFTVAAPVARAGYVCRPTTAEFLPLGTITMTPADTDDGVSGFNDAVDTWPFFGRQVSTFWMSVNGFLQAGTHQGAGITNGPIPQADLPNGVLAPLWDDLVVGSGAMYAGKSEDDAGNGYLAFSWIDVSFLSDRNRTVSFQVVLYASGRIVFQYGGISEAADAFRAQGGSATVGIEDFEGDGGVQRSFNQPVLASGYGIELIPSK